MKFLIFFMFLFSDFSLAQKLEEKQIIHNLYTSLQLEVLGNLELIKKIAIKPLTDIDEKKIETFFYEISLATERVKASYKENSAPLDMIEAAAIHAYKREQLMADLKHIVPFDDFLGKYLLIFKNLVLNEKLRSLRSLRKKSLNFEKDFEIKMNVLDQVMTHQPFSLNEILKAAQDIHVLLTYADIESMITQNNRIEKFLEKGKSKGSENQLLNLLPTIGFVAGGLVNLVQGEILWTMGLFLASLGSSYSLAHSNPNDKYIDQLKPKILSVLKKKSPQRRDEENLYFLRKTLLNIESDALACEVSF